MKALIKMFFKSKKPTSFNMKTPKKLRIKKTVYPNWEKDNDGTPRLSPNGTGEFYGLT
jgi:hypothetical protein